MTIHLYFKKGLENTIFKSYSLLLLKFVLPVVLFVVVELVPLRGGNEFGTRHGLLDTPIKQDSNTFRFSDEHPLHFYRGVPPPSRVM